MGIWFGFLNVGADFVDFQGNRIVKVVVRAFGEQAFKPALADGQAGCATAHTQTAGIWGSPAG